jgi:exodeoxyribonuclease VII small subunit
VSRKIPLARVAAVPRTPAPPAPDDLGYEQARDELVDVVRRLEAGGTTLEESLALWERGEQLAAVCQRWLDGARARLSAVAPADGSQSGDDAESDDEVEVEDEDDEG